MAPNEKKGSEEIQEIRFDLKKLPSWSILNDKIRKIEIESSWMEKYGWDWLHILVACAMVPGSLRMVGHGSLYERATGFFILGCFHCILANKSSHIACHNALCDSKAWGAFWVRFFVEFVGSYSSYMGIDSHVKMHHPHTNIIGLGDSSMWKVPQLSCYPYMFFMPIFLPVITPFVALQQLIELKEWSEIPKFLLVAGSGIALHLYVIVQVCDFSILGAFLLLMSFRAVMAISYIHVNIFQHIGLPMYDQEHRPARIYQMSSGVLNLHSNVLLNITMGHSLVSCHVQHHLFPRLSDNMCKKVEPVVREYLVDNGLPYNEDSYYNRLVVFVKDYNSLMVNAPPITHFVGVQ